MQFLFCLEFFLISRLRIYLDLNPTFDGQAKRQSRETRISYCGEFGSDRKN